MSRSGRELCEKAAQVPWLLSSKTFWGKSQTCFTCEGLDYGGDESVSLNGDRLLCDLRW